jgi:putative glutamine amidotransferase
MIAYKPGGLLELAAVGPDGVVEALEFKNGRGILMQFHPELMQSSFGDSIIKQVLRQEAQVRRAPRCGGLFL